MDIVEAEECDIDQESAYLVLYKIVYEDKKIDPFWNAWGAVCESLDQVKYNLEMCKDHETRVIKFPRSTLTGI